MQEEITIHKVDDVWMGIEAERQILLEIYDEFQFYVPGYQFMPAYKNKVWDGKIKMLNLKKQTMYLGLMRELKDFAHNRGYKVKFAGFDDTWPPVGFEAKEIKEYIDSINIHSDGKPIQLRDYQYQAIFLMINRLRRIILSPTSSGKSAMIYSAMRLIQDYNLIDDKKILIIVPSINLVNQMYNDFVDYSSEVSWDAEQNVHKIMGGEDKETDKKIVISTWQSIFKQPKSYFNQFGAVFCDEVHLAKAESIKGIMEKLEECPYRIGLTGTLDDTKTHELVLKGLFGKVKKVISTKELMDRQQIAELDIQCAILQYPEAECKEVKKKNYQEEIEHIITHEKRNELISSIVTQREGNSLVLFSRVSHGEQLEELIENKSQDHHVFIIHGQIDGNKREEIRQYAEKNKTIIVASYGVFSTGVDIKNIDNVLFASPSKSKIRVLQSIGRGLRQNGINSSVRLYDIVDSFAVGNYKNYALKHFEERLKYYEKESFKYNMKKINL